MKVKLLSTLLFFVLQHTYALGEKTCVRNYELETYRQYKNYENAKRTCESNGSHLAKIDSLTMTDAIRNLTGSGYYYIGLKKSGSTYRWHDGSYAYYTNWNYNYGRDCVIVYVSSNQARWWDRSCSSTYYFICQKKIDPTPSISPGSPVSIPNTGVYKIHCSVPLTSAYLSVTWYDQRWYSEVPTSSAKVYQVKSNTSSQATSKLVLKNVNISDSGKYYYCRASVDGYSGRSSSVYVSISGTPTIDDIITSNCSSQLNVSWTPNPRAKNFKHMLRVYPISGTSLTKELEFIPSESYSATVNGLLASTEYIVEVFPCETSSCSSNKHRIRKFVITGGIPNPVISPKMISNGQNCQVKWNSPRKVVAEITEYMITATKSYQESRYEVINLTESYTVPNTNHTFVMEPNIKYDIFIQAVTCAGPGKIVQASGVCTGPPYAPDTVERPILTQGINDADITLAIPNEVKGLISCIFVVLGDESTSSALEEYVHGTLTVPDDSSLLDQHILMAIPYRRIAGNERLTLPLGDDSTSSCNLFDTGYNETKIVNTKNLIVIAKNKKIMLGTSNKAYVIAAVPYENKVFLRRSEVVGRNWETTTVDLFWEATDEFIEMDDDVHLLDARYFAIIALVVPMVLIALGLGYHVGTKRGNASKKTSDASPPENDYAATGMAGASSSSTTPGGHRNSETPSGYVNVEFPGAYDECEFDAGQDTHTPTQYEECLPVSMRPNPPQPLVPSHYTPMRSQNSNPPPFTLSAYEDYRL